MDKARKKGLFFWGAALLSGAAAAALIYVSASMASPREAVLVAALDLQAGDPLTLDKVKTAYLPPAGLPEDVLRPGADLDDVILSQGVKADDLLRQGKVMRLDARDPALLSARLRALRDPGLLGMEVPIDSVSGMLGGMKAGDRVDVLSVYKVSNTEFASETIIRSAPVIGVQPGADKPGVLVIAVSAEQSRELAKARERGKVYGALKPFGS